MPVHSELAIQSQYSGSVTAFRWCRSGALKQWMLSEWGFPCLLRSAMSESCRKLSWFFRRSRRKSTLRRQPSRHWSFRAVLSVFSAGANHQEVQDGKHQYEWKKASHAIEAETGCSGLGVCVGNEHNISSLDFCLTQDSSTMRCVFMHLCGLQENITFFLAKSIEYWKRNDVISIKQGNDNPSILKRSLICLFVVPHETVR